MGQEICLACGGQNARYEGVWFPRCEGRSRLGSVLSEECTR